LLSPIGNNLRQVSLLCTRNTIVLKPEISDTQILDCFQETATYEQGFRLLLQKYQERLYWHIRRMVVEHEDANDVVQNCLLKVYRNISKFRGQSQLYTWLYRIATNEAITFLKKKKRNQTTDMEEAGSVLANQLKSDPFFDGNEVQAQLQQAIQQLPEKQRMVFNLRYFEEMSYRNMSEILDTSEGALKASYHHAVKKIEVYFQQVEIR